MVAQSKCVTLDVSPEGIAVLRMHDPEGNNALSREMVTGLESSFFELAQRTDVRVVVLAGTAEVFSSGASREILEELVTGKLAPRDLLLPRAIFNIPVPTIAAMEGHAIGGGLALGICADIVLIARESRYGCSFMNLGFTPGMATTRILEQLVSSAVAHEMLFTGQPLKGSHFEYRSGFNYILPRGEVMAKAMDLAARIAEKPRVPLLLLKSVLSMSKRALFEQARTVETLMHQISFQGTDVERLIQENL